MDTKAHALCALLDMKNNCLNSKQARAIAEAYLPWADANRDQVPVQLENEAFDSLLSLERMGL